MKNYGWTTLFGGLAGVNGFNALENLLDFANTKAAVLQTQLANAPEITEQVCETAQDAAYRLAGGDLMWGIGQAVIAGSRHPVPGRRHAAPPHHRAETTGPRAHLCSHHRSPVTDFTGKPGCAAGRRRQTPDPVSSPQTAAGPILANRHAAPHRQAATDP